MKAHLVLPAIYGALFIAALMVMFATAKQTAFCGIYAVLLTIPWSLLAIPICSAAWPGLFDVSMLPSTLILSFCGVLNCGITFLIGTDLDGFWCRKRN
jgi:hypothetical protein